MFVYFIYLFTSFSCFIFTEKRRKNLRKFLSFENTDSHRAVFNRVSKAIWNRPFPRLSCSFCLGFKPSPGAKPFMWKRVSLACSFSCKSNSFSLEWLRTRSWGLVLKERQKTTRKWLIALLCHALWLVLETRATYSTNQMRNQNQSRLDRTRFPALGAECAGFEYFFRFCCNCPLWLLWSLNWKPL